MGIKIDLDGWIHVHTWKESHGECVTDVYQQEISDTDPVLRSWKPNCLEISYYKRPLYGALVHVHVTHDKDYLLARRLRKAIELKKASIAGDEDVSPCYTSSQQYVEYDGDTYKIVHVVGHGEWAYLL